MFLVVEAAHNENGQLNDGIPGDQTKDEVRIRQLGSGDFTYILRCPDTQKAKCISEDAIKIAENDHVGYSQYSKDTSKYSARYGLWYAMRGVAIPVLEPSLPVIDDKITRATQDERVDFSQIKTDCNTDCSQLVSCVLTNNGYQSGMYMSTSTELKVLTELGFTKLKYSMEALKDGDILWRTGHTGIAVRVPDAEIPPQPKPPVSDGSEDKETGEMFSVVLKSSTVTKTWSTGAGPNSRKMPYLIIPKSLIGFTPNVICVQQQGEVLSLCQWMREQNEGFMYVSNFENNASAGVAVGTKAGYFNPDGDKLIIPVRFPNKAYIVKIYK